MIKALFRLLVAYYYYVVSGIGVYLLRLSAKHVEREVAKRPELAEHVVTVHQALSEPAFEPSIGRYGLHVKVEYEGEIQETTMWYEDEDEAYEMYNQLKTTIDPIVIRM